jgi:hypothetical protein
MRVLGLAGLACFGVAVLACGSTDSGGNNDTTGNDSGTPPPGDDTSDDGGTPPPQDAGKPKDGSTPVDAGPFVPAPHPGYPQLPSAGTVTKNPKIVTVVAPSDTLASDLTGFGDALVASNWWKVIAGEYGLGTATHVKITGGTMPALVTGSQMRQYIQSAITGHAEAQPNGHTIYILYLPKGTNDVNPVNGRTNDANCSEQYGGYHQPYGQSGDSWGFARRCPTQGTGLSELQSLTVAGSHEVIESATDPSYPTRGYSFGQATSKGNIWEALPGGGEVGDLCNEETMTEGIYTFTRVWSNAAAASSADPCAPSVTPYFNAAPTKLTQDGWYDATNGTATIDITAYSTVRTNDWYQYAVGTSQSITATVTGANMKTIGGQKIASINNSQSATLTVTGGQPGESALVLLVSESGSTIHSYPVGIRF